MYYYYSEKHTIDCDILCGKMLLFDSSMMKWKVYGLSSLEITIDNERFVDN